MAQQKKETQAQRTERKKNKPAVQSAKKNSAELKKKAPLDEENRVPFRLITSSVFISLFVVCVVMLIKPDGVAITLLYDFIRAMIGQMGFYILIPALLYLFIIHAFSNKRPILMRSICVGSFVLCVGSFAHLVIAQNDFSNLYFGGINGENGGIICGFVGSVLRWLCDDAISYIILSVAGVFTLLGAFQITIPSLVRAYRNRPKADWEEVVEDQPDPASIVVNHLATKRIEHMENKRRAKEEDANQAEEPQNPAPEAKKPVLSKTEKIIRQIDKIDSPVSSAESNPVYTPVEPEPDILSKPETREIVISDMPLLELESDPQPPTASEESAAQKVSANDAQESAAQVAAEIAMQDQAPKIVYNYPPIELLSLSKGSNGDATGEMRENAQRLDEALASFGVNAHIINVTRGPSVTRYEVELEKGVKLSRVTNVANDLALSLGVAGVRIATVVGKISVVGIEVPNKAVTTVSLREVIDSAEFSKAKSKSSFAVGKDIGGKSIVGNIAKLPHMLIAGTTGSGKSVCMNSIIISLLYKASPDDVKLIMIDPKMVELGIYNGIPHLLIPVVTDPKKAAGSLQWAVVEMMRRYKAMSDVGVRDLESYNSIMEAEEGQKMPQVVVIVDELADLMLVASKEVEESICRIAQMGRAAGIHLIIATQRPSADVITGLMKANIPSRIAFSVASAMESRIILDTQGAEKLVGKGDMLFAPIGCGKPLRVQGCFVDESEVEAVANYVKENFSTDYDQGVMEEIERKAAQSGNGGKATASDPEPNADELGGDEMLPAAVDVILETGQASVSMLQRRLKLGYARAARIVDEMEEKGIVGPFQGSKPRTILITKEQWDSMKSGQPQQMSIDEMEDSVVPEDI